MKSILFLLCNLFVGLLSAQTFNEVTPSPPFVGVALSSSAFSDVNEDGYPDVLITGMTDSSSSFEVSTRLYLNNSSSEFSEVMNTPFEAVLRSSIAFVDVNGDEHVDVFITGQNLMDVPVSILYTNDGSGNFTEVQTPNIEGVGFSSIAFADVNGDDSPDLLISGKNNEDERITKLYLNDGNANFTEIQNTPFTGIAEGEVAFADVNGDQHQDIMITGLGNSFSRVTKLYTNDGMGNFTEIATPEITEVGFSALAFADVDGDEDMDVLVSGFTFSNQQSTKLYLNDGDANFTPVINTPFEGVYFGSIAFADVNDDGHSDVLVSGINSSIVQTTKLYLNDGNANFTEVENTPFEGTSSGSLNFADIDGDEDFDLLITGDTYDPGGNNFAPRISKLYINNTITSIFNVLDKQDFEFSLFPVPASLQNLTIRFTSEISRATQIKVMDIRGRLLIQQKISSALNGQEVTIDISSLSTGTYLIEIDDGQRRDTKKFLIQ